MKTATLILVVVCLSTAVFGQDWLGLDQEREFQEFGDGYTADTGSLEEALKMDPVMSSDPNIIREEPLKIGKDVAVITYDEPGRLYVLEKRRLKAYLGEFRGTRIYRFEDDPSFWQSGPAIGAGYSLTPNISIFTEYHRGWWGLDYWDWMTERGDTVNIGIRFEFGGTRK